MHLISRLRKPLLSGRRDHQPAGAVLIALLIAIMVFAALGTAIYTISSSDTYGNLASNLSARAYYAAESGYRYVAGSYRDEDGMSNKMSRLKSLHGITRNLPDGLGSFSATIQPYFFITTDASNTGDNYLSVTTPGEFPPGFTAPATPRISIGGAIYDTILEAQTPPDSADFQITAGLGEDVDANTIVCLVAETLGTQTLISEGDLTLSAASGGFFPDRNGRFQIGPHAHNLVFSYRERDPDSPTGSIVLTGIQGVSTEARTTLSTPLPLAAGSDVTLKPFLRMIVTGSAAGFLGSSRNITYAVPITDEMPVSGLTENEELLIDNFDDLDNWRAPKKEVQTSQTVTTNWGEHQGGVVIESGEKPGKPGKKTTSVFLSLDMSAELEDAWERGNNFLSYDVQIKHKWDPLMPAAADGINVRWNDPGSSGKFEGLGVSFMYYFGIGPGFNDYIPDSIKPPGMAGKPLIVLWEQRVSGASVIRQWIAYKNLKKEGEEDIYVLGHQTPVDGQVFNDFSSLFVRVEENSVNGAPKTNTLKVFYGDASTLSARATILGNDTATDFNRWIYPPSWSGGSPGILWPVNAISDWSEETDYMSLVVWDEMNMEAEGYQLAVDRKSVSTTDFVTPDDVFSSRDEIGLHAFGDLSNTILFDDFAAQILGQGGGAGQSSGFAIPLQQ